MSTLNSEEEQFKKLSNDLLVYLSYLETAYNQIEESEEKVIIQEWLQFILTRLDQDVGMARLRNMALSKLSMDIDSNQLYHPFNERPSIRSYAELIKQLKSELNENKNEEHDESNSNDKFENHELDISEFDDTLSVDNRTYIALRHLPNHGGVFGYIAISIGDGRDTQWLSSKGHPIPTPVPSLSYLPVESIKNDIEEEEENESDTSDATLVWNVLLDRSTLCLRNSSLKFYQTLYDSVEQEMLAEKNNAKCSHPLITELLRFLEIDFKAIGVTDLKKFRRLDLLSVLKKQIKSVISEIKRRSEILETSKKVSTMSPILILPPKCCYDFVTSTLSIEIYKEPAKKDMDILSSKYPQEIFPKYFSALVYAKKQILISVIHKYCNIMDEMFADLENSLMSNMKKYKDAKWEWHLAHEILDAYKKEKAYKDSLCEVEKSSDETTHSFLTVILNEIEMAQNKLKSLMRKNDKLAQQLPELRNEIADARRNHKTIRAQNEENLCKLTQEINFEKRDITKRTSTIAELESRLEELK